MAKNLELKNLKKIVLEQQASLSGMKGELVALGEERQKLEQEVIPVAETEETKPEIAEIKEEITIPEEIPENTEVKQSEIEVVPEPEKIPENKPKTKAEKRAENRKKNGIEEKPKKDKQKIDETREKVLASMEQKEEEKEEIKNLGLEDKKDADKDTLEQKVEYFNLTGKDINRIAQKIKNKEYLEEDARILYEQNPQLFESAIKTKWRSAKSLLAGGYLWLQQKFLTTPKTEKIVISDEEIAENHPEIPAEEDKSIEAKKAEKEARKAEFNKRMHETLSITDMGAAYGIERARIAAETSEAQEEFLENREKNLNLKINLKTPEWVKNSFGKTKDWLKNNTKKVGSLVMEKMGELKNWGSEKIENTKFIFSGAKIEEFDIKKISENIKTETLREEIARGGNFGPNHEIEKRQFVLEQFMKEKENYLNQKKLILDEHKIKKLEKLGKLGDFIKLCEKGKENTREFWKNLDNSKIGRLSKIALSSGIMSASVGLTGAGLGWIPGTRIGSRMATNMLIATGVNMAFSSNRPEQVKNEVNNQKAKNFLNKNLTAKSLKTLGYGASLTAGFLSGGFPLGLASLGIGVGSEYLRKKINEYIQKKSKEIEDKQDKNKLTHKIAFANIKDDFDVEKLSENLSWVNSEIENAQKMAKNLSIFKTVSQKGLTYGTGLATMFAFSTENVNAQNQQNQTEHNNQNNDTKTEEVEQNQAPNPVKSEAPTVNVPENTTQTPAPEIVDPNTTPAPTPAPTPTPETKVPEVNLVEVKPNDGGVSQVLSKIENRPDWFEKVLGKDTPENWAKLMKKIGTFNPEDPSGKDSFTIHPGDKIGLTDNKEIIFERGGQNFVLGKVDEHGHLEEGDWMDKMQDEKFMDTGKYSGEISNASNASNTNEGGGPTVVDDNDFPASNTENQTGGPTIINENEKIDPNKIVEPEKLEEGANAESKPEAKEPELKIEKQVIDPNPYKLGPAQLDYINKDVYSEKFLDHVFKDEESLKWWNEIGNTKSATDFLNLDKKIITDEAQKKVFVVLESIYKTTGLEPIHSSVLQPELPNETIKQYILRGLQDAYMKGNLNNINIEARPITI